MTFEGGLLVIAVVAVALAAYAVGRLQGLSREIDRLYDIVQRKRIPYSVIEQIEDIQAVGVRRLRWIQDALEQAIVEHDRETEILTEIRGAIRSKDGR